MNTGGVVEEVQVQVSLVPNQDYVLSASEVQVYKYPCASEVQMYQYPCASPVPAAGVREELLQEDGQKNDA